MRPPRRAVPALTLLIMLTAGCTADDLPPRVAGPTPAPSASLPPADACNAAVTRIALPTWARTGFSGDGTGAPHVLSERGDLVAVLFEYPPVASADPQLGSKILWVSRLPQEPMQPLRIQADLDGTTTSVKREIPGGPGPSSVQLPLAGCWRLALSWSGHEDRMTLQFS